jgi:hypothetical protein
MGPKVETLNTFSPLVANDLTLFSRAVTRMKPYTRPTGFCECARATNSVSAPARYKMTINWVKV